MQKYKVISLSVSGKGPQKIYYSGQIVTQDNLNASVDDLERQGFIEKAEDDSESPIGMYIPEDPFTVKQAVVSTESKEQSEDQESLSNKDPKRGEMIYELDMMGIKYNKNLSKAELFDLYKKAISEKK
jgi:T4 recombination endonuclease VII, dimerisation